VPLNAASASSSRRWTVIVPDTRRDAPAAGTPAHRGVGRRLAHARVIGQAEVVLSTTGAPPAVEHHARSPAARRRDACAGTRPDSRKLLQAGLRWSLTIVGAPRCSARTACRTAAPARPRAPRRPASGSAPSSARRPPCPSWRSAAATPESQVVIRMPRRLGLRTAFESARQLATVLGSLARVLVCP